ncbi:amino acid ABC transporter substrate-binding protein [Micromonospora lutea]|uniref:Amino acid ABC transporter substrate-binding protein n=1 Tax=Micromonospora lutea TaxID=419825 RepID=A0ABQ4J1P8_9ACTN|nr:amino acid ABC transporter substrate-binding protein [Micromonospora lutea]
MKPVPAAQRSVVAMVVFLTSACASTPGPQPSPTLSADCRTESLQTITPGRITWAARDPGHAPWTIDDPADGRGYEAAVAAAVSRHLGFPRDRTQWVQATKNTLLQPGPKDFDLGFDQVPVTPQREPNAQFSSPYYDVRQAVIARDDNLDVRSVTTAADLASVRLGAPAGSAALASIAESIRPAAPPTIFHSSDDAKNALLAGSIEALVVDLPTAFYLTTVELTGTRVVGALPQTTPDPERFGFVLPADSPLGPCVATAISDLRRDGTLRQLEETWLGRSL